MPRKAPASQRPSPSLLAAVLVALLLMGVFPRPAATQGENVSIDALMSAPFPYGISAAPSGGAMAWVQNERGVRNIWVATPPEYEGRRLTSYERDDGQELSIAAWSPDGRSLVFVRGGGTNRQGESANPTSDPDGVEQSLFRIDLDGGTAVEITTGGNATVSPDGSGFAFTRGGQIWYAFLDGRAEPHVLASVRGAPGSLRWSPDGARLAFVSNRGTHAFIGVLGLEERTIRWIDPGVDRDGNPVWSPDGSRIAFTRFPASSELTSFRPVREAPPWSIRLADAESGDSREIWRAGEGAGSAFSGVNAPNQLLWAADDRIVFPWEESGWRLLYAVPSAGGAARLLTPGEFEVADAALAPDGRQVIYSSNEGDLHRRHLWRVPVAGGSPELLTAGDGLEFSPTPLSEGGLAFLRSDARTPAHAAFLSQGAIEAGQGSRADPVIPPGRDGGIPSEFPTHALVTPEPVTVTAADGMEVPAQLFLPPDLRDGDRRPALAFFHGGSRRQMLLGFHDRSYYHYAYSLNQYLALQGYVVLSVNYRSGTGYGLDFREAVDYGAAGGSEFQDVLGAGLYLKKRPDVDPDRIGLWGGSYGGYLTAMGLSRASDLFAAGVDLHGVHDWNVGIATFRPDYNPLEDPERSRTSFLASPMATLDGWRSPVLLIHGDDDRNVRFVETVTLVEALRKRDVHTELLVFPDEVHSFLLHRNWLEAYEATADFFRRMFDEPRRAGANEPG